MRRTIVAIPIATAALSIFATGAAAAPKCGDNTGKAATGEPITIGAIVGRTGPDDFSASAKGAKAFFDCLNANGGVKGRPVRYLVMDDQWNPEVSAQLAAKLVNDEKAVAIVGNASFVECGANAATYAKAGVIALIGVGVPRECFNASNIVATNAGPRVSTAAAAQYAAETMGAKNFVCVAPNIPNVGAWACDGVAAWATSQGGKSTAILIDPGSADATSVVLQAANLKPDAIIFSLPKGLLMPMMTAAEEQGLQDKFKFLAPASGYDRTVPGALGKTWNGKFHVNMEFNALDSKEADNQNWLQVMDAYAQSGDPRDTFAQAGYLAARVATEAMMTIEPGKISRETVTAAIGKVKKFQSDIFCAPWYFADKASGHYPNSTTRMAVTDNGSWKPVSACRASADPELASVRAYEKTIGLAQ